MLINQLVKLLFLINKDVDFAAGTLVALWQLSQIFWVTR
jgi:hypothetical protein